VSTPSSPSERPKRVAVIGFGIAGELFHAPFVAATPGLELTTIVTSDPERAARAHAQYPGATVCETASEVWADRANVDLVVVAAPNAAHVSLATAAIESGIAVVIDKPLAATASEGRRLADLARQRGVLLTVFQNRRYDGDFQTIRRLLDAGTLGDPLRFESRFERWRMVPKPGWRESGAPADAGGLLMDLGSHLVDQALQLFGPVASVYAELDRRRPGVEVDDDAFVALTHASGVRSHLWMSVLASQLGPRFRLLGTAGSYVKFGLDMQEDELRAGRRPGTSEWGMEPAERWGVVGAGADARPVQTERGDYGRFYAAVAESLRTGTPPPVAADDAVATLRVLEMARQSAAEQRVVRPSASSR
jgi:predicted dehydrogenase